jgi:hypothetical protein
MLYIACSLDTAEPSNRIQVQKQGMKSLHKLSVREGKRPVKVSEKAK